MLRLALLAAAGVLASRAPALAQGAPAVPRPGPDLVEALRRGGHVLYLRHTRADVGEDDTDDLADCAHQRNLSPLGRAQATHLGEAVRRLGVPVGTVLASPFCRTLDTARLAFGRAEVADDLRGAGARIEAERSRVAAALRRRLTTSPEPGTNTVLVAHNNNLRWLEGVPLEDGETAVYRPEGEVYRLVARLRPDEWAGLEPR